MKNISLKQILEEKVFIPVQARNWSMVDLPFSKS